MKPLNGANTILPVARGETTVSHPASLTTLGAMGSKAESMPYWHVNVPEAERTDECPDFLVSITDKDRGIISTPDDQYHVETWPEVQRTVAGNRLDLFQRVPSELRRYLAYIWKLKQEYGSIPNFILRQRLQWEVPIVARGKPFEFDDDLKILCNDWPYGIDKRIVHLVVWTKFALKENPETGDLTAAARAEIDAYVQKTFCSRMPRDRVSSDVNLCTRGGDC